MDSSYKLIDIVVSSILSGLMVSVCEALNWVVWTSNYEVGRYKTNASSFDFNVNYVSVEYFK